MVDSNADSEIYGNRNPDIIEDGDNGDDDIDNDNDNTQSCQ